MKEIIFKSHNDYLNKRPVIDGIMAGCQMIEADIITSMGKVMVSHSYRPFRLFCHGSFQEYYNKLKFHVNQIPDIDYWLYIEYKGRVDPDKLYNILRVHMPVNLNVCISALRGKWYQFWRWGRYEKAKRLMIRYGNRLNLKWLEYIESIYLVKSKYLYKK